MAQRTTGPHTQPFQQSFHDQPMQDRPTQEFNSDSFTTPRRLRMQIIGEQQKTIELQIKERMLIGRADPDSNYQLDLDLSPHNALQNGVSRVHAAITYHDDALYIEDLGSTNGTRINGFRLTSNRAYRLRNGDELEFGRISVVIRFINN